MNIDKFLVSLKSCKNNAVNYIYNRAECNTVGPMGKNIAYLKVCPSVDQDHPANLMDARIKQIRELIRLRDGFDQLDVLNEAEIQGILEFVCVS